MLFNTPDVLFVMAVESEYGPCLKAMIKPLLVGVGPVEAAVNLTACLAGLAAVQRLPNLVVSLGSAGSQRLPQGQVFQVSALSYRDMDVSALGYERGKNPLLPVPAVVELPYTVSGIPTASLSTGGNMVSGAAYDQINADMVDMETYAVWRVCEKFSLPMIALRGISDGQSELRKVSDWKDALAMVDQGLAEALKRIERSIGGWRPYQPIG